MRRKDRSLLGSLLVGAAVALILKVTLTVVVGYRDYWPPNFKADFLLGRESYFFGAYAGAFYVHLIAGPLSLVVGTILISERFRQRFTAWHRRLGKLQIVCVLLFIVPSGLWMSRYAMTGPAAGIGLASLAIATAVCCGAGWRLAVGRRFAEHQRWMWRTYLLLCSAVVIRIMGGLAAVLELDTPWVYPTSVWASWLMPLVVYEFLQRSRHGKPESRIELEFQSVPTVGQ